jgi:hypothetical protein
MSMAGLGCLVVMVFAAGAVIERSQRFTRSLLIVEGGVGRRSGAR